MSDQRRAQHNAGHDFADHPRLAQLYEELAEELSQPYKKKEQKENRSEVRVGHARGAAKIGCR
jgi:hypothetical protein